MIHQNVLQPRLAEVGRIKIGGLSENKLTSTSGGEWAPPVKFDHFVITSMERDASGNFMKDAEIHTRVGDRPTELDIVLLYNEIDLNFRTELALYNGKDCLCRGNGESASRREKQNGAAVWMDCACPCDHLKPGGKCKPHGVLTCLLRDADVAGGVWRFSTTSWNTIRNITGSLKFISLCTGGKIAGLPLKMRYMKKNTTTPDGKTIKIGTVGLFYQGDPVKMLEDAVVLEKRRLEAGIRMQNLEAEVRREIEFRAPIDENGILDEPEIAEFHPEENADAPTAKDPASDGANNQGIAAALKARSAQATAPTTSQPAQAPVAEASPAAPIAPPPAAPPVQEPQAAPPAAPIDEAAQKKPILDEILALRGKKKIMNGSFTAMVAKAIGKPITDGTKWSVGEAQAVLAAAREYQTQVSNGGAA